MNINAREKRFIPGKQNLSDKAVQPAKLIQFVTDTTRSNHTAQYQVYVKGGTSWKQIERRTANFAPRLASIIDGASANLTSQATTYKRMWTFLHV